MLSRPDLAARSVGAAAGIDWGAVPPAEALGRHMHALMAELLPIARSLTSQGPRDTFHRLAREVPLALTEVPSGTRLYDWTVRDEWSLHGAVRPGLARALLPDPYPPGWSRFHA